MRKLLVTILAIFSMLGISYTENHVVEATLTNCSVWYGGTQAYGYCGGWNSNAPIQNHYYVYTKCHNPLHPDYWVAGNFVNLRETSTATCAAYFQPQSAYLVKTA